MEYRQILAVGCPACVVDLASGVAWIDKYRRKARPQLASDPDDGTVFLSVEGGPFHPDRLSTLARECVEAANLGKRGACHMSVPPWRR